MLITGHPDCDAEVTCGRITEVRAVGDRRVDLDARGSWGPDA